MGQLKVMMIHGPVTRNDEVFKVSPSCTCTPNYIRAHRKKFSDDKNIIWVIEGTD